MPNMNCSSCGRSCPEEDMFHCQSCQNFPCLRCAFKDHRDPSAHDIEDLSDYVASSRNILLDDVKRFAEKHANIHSLMLAIEEVENSFNTVKEIKQRYMKAVMTDAIVALQEEVGQKLMSFELLEHCRRQNTANQKEFRSAKEEIDQALAALTTSASELRMTVSHIEDEDLKTQNVTVATVGRGFKGSQQLGSQPYIIITGGRDQTLTPSQNVWVLSELSSTDAIRCVPLPHIQLQKSRSNHQTVYVDGAIISFGGVGQDRQRVTLAEWLDVNSGLTKSIADFATPRSCFAAGVIGQGIYASGGTVCDSANPCELYDVSTDKWYTFCPMLMDRGVGLSGAVLDDHFYVTGGTKAGINVEVYDPSTDSWKICSRMHNKRHFHCCAALGGSIYACGGGSDSGLSCERYDPRSDEWGNICDMNTYRYEFAMVAVGKNLWAIGGIDRNAECLSCVELYDPRNDKWVLIDDVIQNTAGISAVVL